MELTRRRFMEIAVVTTGTTLGILPMAGAIPEELINKEKNMQDRKYVIETRRYIGKDGQTTFDQWVTSANVIEVKHDEQYLVFYPLEGEFAGKKHYIPFYNIHVVREL